jgi:hypothetical protein
MYAKLFSRITESSLMEEPVSARYTFMMLLAIADPSGHVIGTDVAIARRMNLPTEAFIADIASLMLPDADSNSKAEDGRRVVESDGERGYRVVNYLVYRDMKNEDQKRAYMRDYMRSYRGGKGSVKPCKTMLAQLAHAEAEAEAEEKATTTVSLTLPPLAGGGGGKSKNLPTNPQALRIAALFARRPTTAWSEKEVKEFRAIGEIHDDDLALMERYYASERAKGDDGRERRDMGTFLNNFAGELDRAKRAGFTAAPKPVSVGIRETPMDKMLRENEEMFADGEHPDKWRAANPGKPYIRKSTTHAHIVTP